jgi:hypothetical protein
VLVRHEDGHLGAVDGLAEEAELDERLGDAHGLTLLQCARYSQASSTGNAARASRQSAA